MLGSSLDSPLNWPTNCRIWNMVEFNLKLLVMISSLTILKLNPSNWGIARSAKTLLLALASCRFRRTCSASLPRFWVVTCFLSYRYWAKLSPFLGLQAELDSAQYRAWVGALLEIELELSCEYNCAPGRQEGLLGSLGAHVKPNGLKQEST